MSMIQSDLLLGQEGGAGYGISRSLRFNSSDSAYLSRTPSTAGNRKTWTWAGWVKKTSSSTADPLFASALNSSNYFLLLFDSYTLSVLQTVAGAATYFRVTTAQYRDPGAWMHVVLAIDTTQATAANRIKLYVNGAQVTAFNSSFDPSLNQDLQANQAWATYTGRADVGASVFYFNGYLADIHFIDGQALTPSSFTEVSATTGRLEPKAYSGPTPTGNSFWLPFSDNSAATATTLGKDNFNLGNNWTPNNLSVTAGAGNDSLVDTPTSYGTDTGAGGEVRGNYATLNPLSQGPNTTLSNGNLGFLSTSTSFSYRSAFSSIGMTSGKWYFEASAGVFGDDFILGLSKDLNGGTYIGGTSQSWGYEAAIGATYNNGTSVSTGYTTYTTGDIISVAFDADNGRLFFAKNGSWQGSGNPATGANPAYTGLTSGPYFFGCAAGQNGAWAGLNFGQRPFAYTAPSGFKALCDTNLPAPTIARPSTVFDTKLYTSNAGTLTVSGLGFSPDFAWLKSRGTGVAHALYDTVRGAGYALKSNTTEAEQYTTDGFVSFNSDGFTLGANNNSPQPDINYTNNIARVAWCWDAGSTTVTDNTGSIQSTRRTNASAGFSVVSCNAQTSGVGTFGHGLNVAPSFVIVKLRAVVDNWYSYHSSIGATNYVVLNLTNASAAAPVWNNTAPTSTVFTLGASYVGQGSLTAYCFAPVAGYSAFGSYTGNSSSNGPFVYLGFRPRWLLLKRTDTFSNWFIFDTARDVFNVANDYLLPNTADAEAVSDYADLLSNGFKVRSTAGGFNASAGTYIYAAFAESPFALARAR